MLESTAKPQSFEPSPPSDANTAALTPPHPSCAPHRALPRRDEQRGNTGQLIDLFGESVEQVRRAEAIRELAWCMVVRELYRLSCLGKSSESLSSIRQAYMQAFNERPYASFWIGWYARIDAETEGLEKERGDRHRGKPYR